MLVLEGSIVPVPQGTRNFSTRLAYDERSDSVAYGSGKSAYVTGVGGVAGGSEGGSGSGNDVVQFTGHGANVSVVRFAPVGAYMCSGDESGKVIVWSWNRDGDGGVECVVKAEFQVLAGPVTDISWDFEGKRLCVVGEGRDKFGVFISWDTGNSLGEVTAHSSRVNAVHIKQSRPMRCITVGDDGTVVFYQGPPFKFVSSDRTHHDKGKFVRDVEFSKGAGEFAVTVGSDRKIACFDGKSGEFVKYIEDADEPITGGLFAVSWLDETRFVTASADQKVRVWDVRESKCLHSWTIGEPNTLQQQQIGVVAAKDDQIISLSLDGTLNFLKIGEDKPVRTMHGHNKSITALAVNPLVTGSYDGRIMQWVPEKLCDSKMQTGHTNLVVSIGSKESGYSSVAWDDTLRVNNEVKYKFESQPKCASMDPAGKIAVVTTEDKLLVLDSSTGEKLVETALDVPASAVHLSGDLVAIGSEQTNTVSVYNSGDLSLLYKLPDPLRATPSCISIAPSHKLLAVGDVMGKIILYDLETKTVKTSRWAFHTSKINAISWRPEEEDLVATGSLDTHIIVYSVSKPMRTVKVLNAHKDGVNAVQWKDRDHIVSAGADACIHTWKFTQ